MAYIVMAHRVTAALMMPCEEVLSNAVIAVMAYIVMASTGMAYILQVQYIVMASSAYPSDALVSRVCISEAFRLSCGTASAMRIYARMARIEA